MTRLLGKQGRPVDRPFVVTCAEVQGKFYATIFRHLRFTTGSGSTAAKAVAKALVAYRKRQSFYRRVKVGA